MGTQALTAVWFYRLFRSVDTFAAGTLAAFGLVNAVAILGSAAFLATALEVALDPVGADAAGDTQLMYLASGNLWGVGALFFGLWLILMGCLVMRTVDAPTARLGPRRGRGRVCVERIRRLPRSRCSVVAAAFTGPASVGEFWMIGCLLIRGVNEPALTGPNPPT